MSHDLRDDDAVVAVRGAVQPVNRLGGNAERGVKADGRVGQRHIVVDGFRESDDMQALFHQTQRILLRAAAPDADESIEPEPAVIGGNRTGHVPHRPLISMRCGLSRLVPSTVPPR